MIEPSGAAPSAPCPPYEAVAHIEDLGEGGLLGIRTSAGDQICVFKFRGEVGAVADVCTHAEFLLSDGTMHPDGSIECAWHGARFDCWTGAVRRGPACDPVARYAIRVSEGVIYVGPARA